MKRVGVNVDQMAVFLITKSVGIMINAGLNVKNCFINAYPIKDLFGILVIASANVINHVMLVNMQTMKIVGAGKKQLINQLKNVLKILTK